MFSQTAEYALRAVVWLAAHPELPLTTQQIASAAQVPSNYLSKVMQALGRAGLVGAQRGKNGGFTLSLNPGEITVLEVINAVDPIRRIRTCPLSLKGHERLCPLHRRLDEAFGQMERAFRETRISELLQNAEIRPLCQVVETSR